jgi:CDGSH-type Zn-finger protein
MKGYIMFTPNKVELEVGKKYNYCTCGKSSDLTFCDGSHIGSEFKPLRFSVEDTKTYPICRCKKTKNPPYCDGSHRG